MKLANLSTQLPLLLPPQGLTFSFYPPAKSNKRNIRPCRVPCCGFRSSRVDKKDDSGQPDGALAMFCVLFGWRKASKCKRLIKRVQCRLKLLKSKRSAIARHIKEDMAKLVKSGYEELAFDRAGQLFEDENVLTVYDLLGHFCEFILIRLPYIRRHKDYPDDINEAVSTLVYASARCGDIPELREIRKLFGERYGDSFIKGALEDYPRNLINHEIREKLSMKSVTDGAKVRVMGDVFREYCLQPEILAIKYASGLQKQMKEFIKPHVAQGTETRSVFADSTATSNELAIVPVMSLLDDAEGNEGRSMDKAIVSSLLSSGNSPQFSQRNFVYIDDVEEIQSSLRVNGNYQDQRLFKFKPFPVPSLEITDDGFLKERASWDSGSVLRPSIENKTGSEKRTRRSVSRDNQFMSYYNDPNKKSNRKNKLNQHKNRSIIPPVSEYEPETFTRHTKTSCCKTKICSLEHPCINHVASEEDTSKDSVKQYKLPEVKSSVKPLASPHVAVLYSGFIFPRKNTGTGNIELDQKDGFVSVYDYLSSADDEQGIPVYVRAMTMPPPGRPREMQSDKLPRSHSCPFQYPDHVHPKLPDYEEIAAKFLALKKEYVQSKVQYTKLHIQ